MYFKTQCIFVDELFMVLICCARFVVSLLWKQYLCRKLIRLWQWRNLEQSVISFYVTLLEHRLSQQLKKNGSNNLYGIFPYFSLFLLLPLVSFKHENQYPVENKDENFFINSKFFFSKYLGTKYKTENINKIHFGNILYENTRRQHGEFLV